MLSVSQASQPENELAGSVSKGRRRQKKAPRGTWSSSVALDRRHRPQSFDRPSSTVRREWARAPQEAHLFDEKNGRYRRLTVAEIAILQGFDPDWFDVAGVSDWNLTSAAGDAVPPPLGRAVFRALTDTIALKAHTTVEICAGAGGLASAATEAGMQHDGLYEKWLPAVQILSSGKPWSPSRVRHLDVREVDWSELQGSVGLLSGGPPCQPWSAAGIQARMSDERDLLRTIHTVVAELQPEAFVFENVPGLVSASSKPYLNRILSKLRSAGGGRLSYGVIAGVLQAADFGVPQHRRRVFIVGIRGASNAVAHKVLDRAFYLRSHRSPHMPDSRRLPWVTVREALSGRSDPGGWKPWTHGLHDVEGEGRYDRSAAY